MVQVVVNWEKKLDREPGKRLGTYNNEGLLQVDFAKNTSFKS